MCNAVGLELDGFRLGAWVIGSHNFNKAPITRRFLVGDNNSIKGFLLGTHTAQANTNHDLFFSLFNYFNLTTLI